MFNKFALLINQSPESPDVQTAIKEWFDFLNKILVNILLMPFTD